MGQDFQVERKAVDLELIEEYGFPVPATLGAAAMDFRSTVTIEVPAGGCVKIGTGVAYNILSITHKLQLYPRSGLGSRGLILSNTVGIIDSDYQGEVKLALYNRSSFAMVVNRGDRIAQGCWERIYNPNETTVKEFSTTTERGTGGFSSTGKL